MSKIDGDPAKSLDQKEERQGRYNPDEITWANRGKYQTILQKEDGRYFSVDNEEHKGFLQMVFEALRLRKKD